jgi:hypothetical protein
VVAVRRETFDRGDFLAFHGFNRRDARTDWLTVDMDGASAALRDAAAELGTGQAEVFTERPEQRSVGIDVGLILLAVHDDRDHVSLPLLLSERDGERG